MEMMIPKRKEKKVNTFYLHRECVDFWMELNASIRTKDSVAALSMMALSFIVLYYSKCGHT